MLGTGQEGSPETEIFAQIRTRLTPPSAAPYPRSAPPARQRWSHPDGDPDPTAGWQGVHCGGKVPRWVGSGVCEFVRIFPSQAIPPAHFRASRRGLTRPDPPLQLIRNQQVSGSSPLAGSIYTP